MINALKRAPKPLPTTKSHEVTKPASKSKPDIAPMPAGWMDGIKPDNQLSGALAPGAVTYPVSADLYPEEKRVIFTNSLLKQLHGGGMNLDEIKLDTGKTLRAAIAEGLPLTHEQLTGAGVNPFDSNYILAAIGQQTLQPVMLE